MMKHSIYILFFSALIISCGGASSEEGKSEKGSKKAESKDTATVVEVDTLIITPDYSNPYPKYLTKSETKIFKEMLGDSVSAELFAMHQAYDSISTHRQMLIYYKELEVFQDRASMYLSDLNASEEFYNKAMAARAKTPANDEYFDEYRVSLDYILDNLKPVDKYLHGLILACQAECTEPCLDLVLNAFKKKAEETEGEDDDLFFELIIKTYGGEYQPSTMSAIWFEPTWDLGGMSLLGSGRHQEFLIATDKLLEAKNIFKDEIEFYREIAMSDASSWNSFAHSKEKVLSELKSILKKVKLTEKESDAIRSQIRDIEKGTEEEFQFDCKTNDCAFG